MNLKNLFQIYALLICLVSTIILIISTSFFLNGVTDLLIPQYKHYSSLIRYESNESYIGYFENNNGDNKKRLETLQQLTPSQLDEKRSNDKKEFLEEQKGRAIESIITSLQWAFVAMVFFFIHWRLYKRAKVSSE